ncbi:hypothetical protein [Segetibacter koreensis]|uniref:hypothetical protein n=1 Tax=Segetibacter koreensis TaxID=398037 RepID=UPI00036D8325|nr:hypothetical protein [Segetibacter koreensis]
MRAVIILIVLITFTSINKVTAQSYEAQQLLLDVQKLAQLKEILKDMKTGYEIVSKGYTNIRDISQGNFNLHQVFLDGLLAVSPVVKNYKRVADIVSYQLSIVKDYKVAFKRFKQDQNFSPDEILYIGKVYKNLFKQSLKNLDKLAMIITASQLRMTDSERLEAIDQVYADIQDKFNFLRDFNNKTSILSLQRTRQKAELNSIKAVYGINR